MLICSQGGCSFQYASEEIKNDKAIVSEVCKYNYENFQYASEKLKQDKNFVIELIKINTNFLIFVSEKLKNDKEIILLACKKNGSSLQYASKELRNDKELVMLACKKNGISLLYASEELRNDKEIVLEACKKNGSSLQYASQRLKNDKEIVLEAIKKNGLNFQYASEELKQDREYIKKLINISPIVIKYTKYNDDKEIALKAIAKKGTALAHLSQRLKDDDEIVLEAIKKDGNALDYASQRIKSQRKYFIIALKNNYNYYQMALENEHIYHGTSIKDKEIVEIILNKNNLVQFLYKNYYKNYVSNLQEKNNDNLYDFIKECLINKNIILNLYYPYGINNELETEISKLIFLYDKDVETKTKIIQKEISIHWRNKNIKIYNDIVKNKDDKKKLTYVLSQYKLNQENIYEFIINNKYLDKQMKEALYIIAETYYGKTITVLDIIDLINEMLDKELSLDEMFRDNIVLKDRVISKKLFYKIYNDTLEKNPFLYNYIKNALEQNKRRGFKKILQLGKMIISSKFSSLKEYEEKFPNYSPIDLLNTLKGTDLYPQLLEKFKNIDGIELGDEVINSKPKKQVNR